MDRVGQVGLCRIMCEQLLGTYFELSLYVIMDVVDAVYQKHKS